MAVFSLDKRRISFSVVLSEAKENCKFEGLFVRPRPNLWDYKSSTPSLSLFQGSLDSRHIVAVSDPIDYPSLNGAMTTREAVPAV